MYVCIYIYIYTYIYIYIYIHNADIISECGCRRRPPREQLKAASPEESGPKITRHL